MSGPIRVCRPDELPALIDGALAEEYWLAPLEADADPTWLAPGHAEPAGGVIVTTSGSTGTPKGVCLSGAALVAGARATQQVVGAHDWLGTLPLHYVAGLMTLVRARVAGTQFVPADLSSANGSIRGRGANAGPAALSIVATQLHRALAAVDTGHPDLLADMAECPVVLVGGSAVDPGLIGRARAAGVNAVTTYGMSETAGGLCL